MSFLSVRYFKGWVMGIVVEWSKLVKEMKYRDHRYRLKSAAIKLPYMDAHQCALVKETVLIPYPGARF